MLVPVPKIKDLRGRAKGATINNTRGPFGKALGGRSITRCGFWEAMVVNGGGKTYR